MTAPALCADRWPAYVDIPDVAVPVRARALLTVADGAHPDPLLWLFLPELLAGQPRRLLDPLPWQPASSTVPIDGEGTWTITTSIGVVAVRSAGGCGRCGSALGRWRPWHPMRRARLPRDLARPT